MCVTFVEPYYFCRTHFFPVQPYILLDYRTPQLGGTTNSLMNICCIPNKILKGRYSWSAWWLNVMGVMYSLFPSTSASRGYLVFVLRCDALRLSHCYVASLPVGW